MRDGPAALALARWLRLPGLRRPGALDVHARRAPILAVLALPQPTYPVLGNPVSRLETAPDDLVSGARPGHAEQELPLCAVAQAPPTVPISSPRADPATWSPAVGSTPSSPTAKPRLVGPTSISISTSTRAAFSARPKIASTAASTCTPSSAACCTPVPALRLARNIGCAKAWRELPKVRLSYGANRFPLCRGEEWCRVVQRQELPSWFCWKRSRHRALSAQIKGDASVWVSIERLHRATAVAGCPGRHLLVVRG